MMPTSSPPSCAIRRSAFGRWLRPVNRDTYACQAGSLTRSPACETPPAAMNTWIKNGREIGDAAPQPGTHDAEALQCRLVALVGRHSDHRAVDLAGAAARQRKQNGTIAGDAVAGARASATRARPLALRLPKISSELVRASLGRSWSRWPPHRPARPTACRARKPGSRADVRFCAR